MMTWVKPNQSLYHLAPTTANVSQEDMVLHISGRFCVLQYNKMAFNIHVAWKIHFGVLAGLIIKQLVESSQIFNRNPSHIDEFTSKFQ